MFGSTQAQSSTPLNSTKGGLFDNVQPSTQSQQSGSLFGTSQPPTTNAGGGLGDLFSRISAPSKPQDSNSLFSTTQSTSQPSKFPSLFSTSQPQSSAPAGGSLFAPASTQSQASSLFAPAAPQAQGSSLFGSQAKPAASSLFGTQPQQQQPQQNNAQQGSSAPRASQPAFFDSLIEKGKKRNRDGEAGSGFQELPNLQLGLGDIAKRVRQIGGASVQQGDRKDADSRAHYLLAASGINPGTTRRDLDSLATQQANASSIPQSTEWQPDNDKYFEQLDQRLTTRMHQQALERVERSFNAYLEENIDINWEQQRKRIYAHFGLTPREADDSAADDYAMPAGKGAFGLSSRRGRGSTNASTAKSTLKRSIFGHSGLQKSVIGIPGAGPSNATVFADVVDTNTTATAGPGDRYLREKQRKYADKVQELNQSRLLRDRSRAVSAHGQAQYSVIQEFLAVETEAGGDSPRQIADAYKALKQIAREGEESKTGERFFATEYLDELPNSAKSVNIRRHILDGSRTSLEKVFLENVESLITKNPREANLGGVPDALSKVRAYVRIRATRKDLVADGQDLAMLGDDYCWALIFYLLRCGLVDEASKYVASNAQHFRNMDRNIVSFITSYAKGTERRLGSREQRDCNNVYSSMTKTAPGDTVDPYRIAVYKVIGRCDLSRRSLDNISQGVEDWIWLQFNLAREVDRAQENAGEVFGLEEIRETVNEIGQRHFQRGAEGLGGFGTYFHLQILGGMFEQAVSYLYAYSYTAAVHFAIALDYYGLLRVSDFAISETDLLTYNTKQLPQISFGRMIGYYTRDFRSANCEAAVDYLALICLNADLGGQLGKSQTSLCYEALRELVLETREFARLLGDIRSNGEKIKGAIQARLPILALNNESDYINSITLQAAAIADDAGRVADAVLLYHLADDNNMVIEILNRALSDAQAVDLSAEPVRLQPLKPRSDEQGTSQNQKADNAGSSLSLVQVDDPVILAQNIYSLYSSNSMLFSRVDATNRGILDMLLRFSDIRARILAGQYIEAYEKIQATNLLPITDVPVNSTTANIPSIRNAANAFNTLPYPVSRNLGPLLLWTITCISKQREMIRKRQYEGVGREKEAILAAAARDLMVFAGLSKYRLGERVWEGVCAVANEGEGA